MRANSPYRQLHQTRRQPPGLPAAMPCALALALALAACRGEETGESVPPGPASAWFQTDRAVVLSVGKVVFTFREFNQFRQGFVSTIGDSAPLGSAENTTILNEFIERGLLLTAARDDGISRPPDLGDNSKQPARPGDTDGLVLSGDELIIQEYLNRRIGGKLQVTEAEAEAHFAQHSGEYMVPRRYHVREILVDDEGLARQIHAELRESGKPRFSAFARQFSRAPSAANGGDLGLFQPGQLPPDFEAIIVGLKPGGYSEVMRTQYGFHIFYLEEVIQSHPQKYYEVREAIIQQLRMDKERAAHAALLDELVTRYRPALHRQALDFVPDPSILTRTIVEADHAK